MSDTSISNFFKINQLHNFDKYPNKPSFTYVSLIDFSKSLGKSDNCWLVKI